MTNFEEITDDQLRQINHILCDYDWERIYKERNWELINIRNRCVMIINRDHETWARYCAVNNIKM